MAKKRKKFDLATQERLCAMVSVGTSVRTAALLCDTTEATVRQRQLRDLAFRERLTEAKQLREIMPLKRLREAAATNWRAAAWLLQRVRPDDYAGPRPHLWRAEEVTTLMHEFSDMLVKALVREVGPGAPAARVRDEILDAIRKVDELRMAGPDVLPKGWPKVRQGSKGTRRAPGEEQLIDDEFRDVDGAGEVNDKSDRGFPGQGTRP